MFSRKTALASQTDLSHGDMQMYYYPISKYAPGLSILENSSVRLYFIFYLIYLPSTPLYAV